MTHESQPLGLRVLESFMYYEDVVSFVTNVYNRFILLRIGNGTFRSRER